MNSVSSTVVSLLVKVGIILVVANEIRGLILAGPVMYLMYEAGGSMTAIWVGICSLAGIAISVIVPTVLARKLEMV